MVEVGAAMAMMQQEVMSLVPSTFLLVLLVPIVRNPLLLAPDHPMVKSL